MKIFCLLYLMLNYTLCSAAEFLDVMQERLYIESPIKHKEKWMGLFYQDGSYTIKEVSVQTIPVPNAITNPFVGCRDAEKILIESTKKPIFLFKDVNNLKEGRVTSPSAIKSNVREQPTISVIFENKEYQLFLKITLTGFEKNADYVDDYREWIGLTYSVFLKSNGISQQIFEYKNSMYPGFGYPKDVERKVIGLALQSFKFLGDLDNDGKLDLIVDKGLGGEIIEELFLSSEAKQDHLLASAASFYYYDPNDRD